MRVQLHAQLEEKEERPLFCTLCKKKSSSQAIGLQSLSEGVVAPTGRVIFDRGQRIASLFRILIADSPRRLRRFSAIRSTVRGSPSRYGQDQNALRHEERGEAGAPRARNRRSKTLACPPAGKLRRVHLCPQVSFESVILARHRPPSDRREEHKEW